MQINCKTYAAYDLQFIYQMKKFDSEKGELKYI